MPTTIKVARGVDPFKKYWWLILLGFGVVGGWVCLPLMDSSTGSGSVNVAQEGGLKGVQSLDALHNPSGAPGSALEMAPSASKSAGVAQTSSLYQAPAEPENAGASASASAAVKAPGESLADALKSVARKPAASADPRGWGEKPQKGFTPPKGNFGALSGFGGSSGSSAGASGGVSTGLTGFSSAKPNTGVDFAKGLQDRKVPDAAKGQTMKALENAKNAAAAAARAGSNDAASAMSGVSFDGGRGGSGIGGGGHATGGGGYAALDAAPVNLKANDPNLDKYNYEPKPPPVPMPKQDDSQMKMMMMMMLMQVVMGGLMGGLGGGM